MTSPLRVIGAGAAVVIVVAAVLVHRVGSADPAADVKLQRASVSHFNDLVRAQDWGRVFGLMAEPPAPDTKAFGKIMGQQVRSQGKLTAVHIDELRLVRSRTVPLLEVRETMTFSTGTQTRTVSYFIRQGGQWLFAFSV